MELVHPTEAAKGDDRFVCVFNRSRDSYQVPVALHEAGLLQALVTDFYAPKGLPGWAPRVLRNKRHDGLPYRLTRSDRLAFAVQYAAQITKLPMGPVFNWIDRRLGAVAGRLAKKSGTNLYCYHAYLPRKVPDDTCLIVFVFHPLLDSYLPSLEEDFALFPEVESSFQMEKGGQLEPEMPIPWSRPDAIVCASSVTARSVIAAGGPAERIAIIPYGLPPVRPLAGTQRATGGEAQFLFVGNGLQRKGIHHLLRAWRLRPDRNARLTVVSYDIAPAIAALADGDPSIRILGYQSREDLDALFAESDVFIMPSLLEGFGLVYLEALSRGCHIIATPNTGVPDLELSGDAATIVPVGDLPRIDQAIEDAIARFERKDFDREAIAAEGRRWQQADFRAAIARHAAAVLQWRKGAGPYPQEHAYLP
jgi:glycosyltransferase involved in cell wall biosynthesis